MKWLEDLVDYAHDALSERERESLYLRGVSDSQIDSYRLGYLDADLPPNQYPSDFLAWWSHHKWLLDDSLVLPLTTTLGHVLGVQFRHVDPKRKGYLDYFASKEEVALFGLYQAMPSVWKASSIWLVEGAFDLFVVQRHIPQVTATLHAGISASFWRVLRRTVDQICLAWDADKTGRAHTHEVRRSAKASSFDIKAIEFPNVPLREGHTKDPNELWEAWGDARLGVFLKSNLDLTQQET